MPTFCSEYPAQAHRCNMLQPADLLRMEGIILDCLSFRISCPTTHTFMALFKQALGLQPRTCAMASYLSVSWHMVHCMTVLQSSVAHLEFTSFYSVSFLLLQELGMLEYKLLQYCPSRMACAATLLAQLYTNDTSGQGWGILFSSFLYSRAATLGWGGHCSGGGAHARNI